MEDASPDISMVLPLFNESANLRPLVDALIPVLEGCGVTFEAIFIDDGSTDGSWETIRAICNADSRFQGLSFSRNFGKEIAIAAGLDHARGKAVVIMDADLQHPPELIRNFIAKWREGYKNIYGQRMDRVTDPELRNFLTRVFYRLLDRFGDTPLPPGSSDFRLLDRQAVKLFSFAFDGLMSFSALPLKVWTYIGLAVSGFALSMAGFYGIRTILFGVDVPGYASLIVSIAFFAGMQLISLGVLGEYIARIFDEVKGRPLYLIAERTAEDAPKSRDHGASA